MWTHSGQAPTAGTPGAESLAQFAEQRFQVGHFLLEKLADVDARGCSCPPQCHDVSDLSESQTQPACAAHEGQQPQDVSGVRAIAGGRAAWHGEDAAPLVQPKSLAAQSAPGRHLANAEPALHERRIGPVPRGKVKGETSWAISAIDHTPSTRRPRLRLRQGRLARNVLARLTAQRAAAAARWR